MESGNRAGRAPDGHGLRPKSNGLGEYTLGWLVKEVLVEMQPAILGGPKKVLKTSVLVDLALSLGSGEPFLGSFAVPRRRRTLLISGESGGFTLKETARRICLAKGVRLEDTDTLWDFRLPKLTVTKEMDELRRGLEADRVEVAMFDPLYLCLLAGSKPTARPDAKNLFDIGPLLLEVAQVCLDVGCMPVLAHHTVKHSGRSADPLDLDDLAYAGVAEFARQWLLISRRLPYQPGSGEHKLWLNVGGFALT
jgi:hypothetical protein